MIQYFPIVTGSLVVLGNVSVSGSINASGSVTISGSIASASYALSASNAATASSADNFLTRGTLTAQTIVVQTITSSVDFVTGSTRFGSLSSNTHVFTGSMSVTGGLVVSAGNVGISTTSPNHQLAVYNTGRDATTALNAGNSNTIPALVIQSSGSDWTAAQNGFAYIYNATNGNLDLYRKSNSPTQNHIMTWARGDGNIGIGTTSPTALLHVSGTTGGVLEVDGASAVNALYVSASGNVGIGTTNPASTLDTRVSRTNGTNVNVISLSDNLTGLVTAGFGTRIQGLSNNNAVVSAIGFENGGTGTNNESQISFYTQNVANALTRQMVVASTGNVGIGIASPSALLHVSSSAAASTIFRVDTAASNGTLFISSSGRIGIGNTNPTETLFLQDPNRNPTIGITHSGGGAYFMKFQQFSGWNQLMTFTSAASYMGINVSGPLILNESGSNVGIGTTNPTSKLEIFNGASSSEVRNWITSTSGYSNYILDTDNNINYRAQLVSFGTTAAGTLLGINRASGSFLAKSGGPLAVGTRDPQPIVFGTNEAERFRISSTGAATFSSSVTATSLALNGSIANSGDAATLTIKQSSTTFTNGIYLERGGERNGYYMYIGNSLDSLTFRRNYFGTQSDVMSLTRDGNVGIGVTSLVSPGGSRNLLQISNGTNGAQIALGSSTSESNNPRIFSGQYDLGFAAGVTTGKIEFYTNDSPRMTITSGGLLKLANSGSTYENSTAGVNEISTNANDTNTVFRNTATSLTGTRAGIDVFYTSVQPNNLSASFYEAADSSGGGRTLRFRVRSNGGIFNYQTNNADISDIRTKTDIVPVGSYWDKFKAIEIVKYKYIDQTHDDYNIGVIAQQVESVAPELIETEDGIHGLENFKSVYTKDLYHASIKVLQEAMAKIETLEAEIEILKNK